MPIRQTLLSLPSFPDAVPERALESAVTLCQLLGAGLTAHLGELDGEEAHWPVVMGAFPLDFPRLMAEMVVKSRAQAAESAAMLPKMAAEYGVALDLRRFVTTPHAPLDRLVDLARLHDLTILPVPEADAFDRPCVQTVLFQSGRPVLLLPSRRKPVTALNRIVIAWDYSREAARAMADALPLLALAREVRLVTVFGEKHLHTTATTGDLEHFLARHGLKYVLDRVSLEEGGIGELLTDYAMDAGADLLVMGAYGHSRLRQFVLGGATSHILRDPPLAVLMSH